MKFATLLAALCLTASTALAQVTFTSLGRPCGGTLTGSVERTTNGPTILMDVSNAAPGAACVLVIGPALRVAQPLPNSLCDLLVDPRITLVGTVDAQGNTTFRMPLPTVTPLTVDFQAVTVGITRRGRMADATNAERMQSR
jgi:hypothetical protein